MNWPAITRVLGSVLSGLAGFMVATEHSGAAGIAVTIALFLLVDIRYELQLQNECLDDEEGETQ